MKSYCQITQNTAYQKMEEIKKQNLSAKIQNAFTQNPTLINDHFSISQNLNNNLSQCRIQCHSQSQISNCQSFGNQIHAPKLQNQDHGGGDTFQKQNVHPQQQVHHYLNQKNGGNNASDAIVQKQSNLHKQSSQDTQIDQNIKIGDKVVNKEQKGITQKLKEQEQAKVNGKQILIVDNFISFQGKVHHLPSFLNNNNLKQMIFQQKKQQRSQTKSFKSSFLKFNSEIKNGQKYSENIRAIKYQTKLKKYAKKKKNPTDTINENVNIVTKTTKVQKPKLGTLPSPSNQISKLFNIKQINDDQQSERCSQKKLAQKLGGLANQQCDGLND